MITPQRVISAAVGLLFLAVLPIGLGMPALLLAADSPTSRAGAATGNSGSRYRLSEEKTAPEGRLNKPKAETPADGDKSAKRAAAERDKMAKMIAARLEKFAPVGKAKRGPDDHFIVGTSEVRLVESHADVRFESVQGQKEVAEQLADYVVGAPPQTLRQWHIFARVKSSEEAESFLTDLRAQWDAMEKVQAQQARLAQSLAYRSAADLRKQMGGSARSMCRT